jgi:hypothetical protein
MTGSIGQVWLWGKNMAGYILPNPVAGGVGSFYFECDLMYDGDG